MARDQRELLEAIDRYGSDLAAWPDRALANDARHAGLADRAFRRGSTRRRRSIPGFGGSATSSTPRSRPPARRVASGSGGAGPVPRGAATAGAGRMVAAAVVVAAGLGAMST